MLQKEYTIKWWCVIPPLLTNVSALTGETRTWTPEIVLDWLIWCDFWCDVIWFDWADWLTVTHFLYDASVHCRWWRHYVFSLSTCLCTCAYVIPSVNLWTWYFVKRSGEFHQIRNLGALKVRGELEGQQSRSCPTKCGQKGSRIWIDSWSLSCVTGSLNCPGLRAQCPWLLDNYCLILACSLLSDLCLFDSGKIDSTVIAPRLVGATFVHCTNRVSNAPGNPGNLLEISKVS